MTDTDQHDNHIPNVNEIENLFINNADFSTLNAQLNRFNPIKIMKMESMEIRHSAILAWLLDPNENHGLGDHFL
ncbi:MAG: PD-(D/E)XK nuclease family protein, partial [Alphaproteobacteria bacterium]